MNSQVKTLAVVSGVLGVVCVMLTILLIAAKAEVATAKAEAATVRLQTAEREAEARKVIARVGELERDAAENQQRKACVAGLKMIDAAKEQWAMDFKKAAYSAVPESELVSNGYLREMPTCPAGGRLTVGRIAEPPSCTVHGYLTP